MYAQRLRIVSCILLLLVASSLLRGEKKQSSPLLVCFGDSITAGYGLAPGQAYPDALQKLLEARGYSYRVVNRGTSGATTKDAVASLPSILTLHPALVVLEFGGNDGLRGLPIDQTRANLDQILTRLAEARIPVLLAGITLPPNYGNDYIHRFEQVYRDLAASHHVLLIPMLYRDLIHVPGTIQEDGIHPTGKGSQILAETLFRALHPLLRKD